MNMTFISSQGKGWGLGGEEHGGGRMGHELSSPAAAQGLMEARNPEGSTLSSWMLSGGTASKPDRPW